MIFKIVSFLILCMNLAFAQIVDINFSGGGTTSYSAWSNLTSFNYPGYGSFPGNQPWPSPIIATDGSVDSSLNRTAGSPTGGGPYPASEAIYFGSFTQVPNALGGTLRLLDSAGITNLQTLLFQIQIGEATGFDFFEPTGFPKLTLGGVTHAATYTNLVNRFQSGVFPSPETGQDEPVYVNTWAFQYNLTNNGFDSYYIDFSAVTHAQVYALRWDGTSVLQNQIVPEPSVMSLLIIAALGVASYMFRKKARINAGNN
jgi:hypothetical protein